MGVTTEHEAPAAAWTPPRHWRSLWRRQLKDDPLDALTPEQRAKLAQLQQQLASERNWSHEQHGAADEMDLYMLRRFLKARDWDVQKARQMWGEMLAFRANNRVDTIATEFVFTERDAVLAAYPHGLHKVDREGRPVLVYRFGAVDLDALNKATSQARLVQFHIQEYERIMRAVLPACSLLAGRHIEKIVTLIDVAGVRMRDISKVMEMLSSYIKVDGLNYPETLGAMVIINAPLWFSGSFALVKGMLSAETQKKMQILGSNYQAALHALIPPENLLPEFGGNSTGSLGEGLGPWLGVLRHLQAEEAAAAARATSAATATATVVLSTRASGGEGAATAPEQHPGASCPPLRPAPSLGAGIRKRPSHELPSGFVVLPPRPSPAITAGPGHAGGNEAPAQKAARTSGGVTQPPTPGPPPDQGTQVHAPLAGSLKTAFRDGLSTASSLENGSARGGHAPRMLSPLHEDPGGPNSGSHIVPPHTAILADYTSASHSTAQLLDSFQSAGDGAETWASADYASVTSSAWAPSSRGTRRTRVNPVAQHAIPDRTSGAGGHAAALQPPSTIRAVEMEPYSALTTGGGRDGRPSGALQTQLSSGEQAGWDAASVGSFVSCQSGEDGGGGGPQHASLSPRSSVARAWSTHPPAGGRISNARGDGAAKPPPMEGDHSVGSGPSGAGRASAGGGRRPLPWWLGGRGGGGPEYQRFPDAQSEASGTTLHQSQQQGVVPYSVTVTTAPGAPPTVLVPVPVPLDMVPDLAPGMMVGGMSSADYLALIDGAGSGNGGGGSTAAGGPGARQTPATATRAQMVQDYVRMWLRGAAEALSRPSPASQQLLDPADHPSSTAREYERVMLAAEETARPGLGPRAAVSEPPPQLAAPGATPTDAAGAAAGENVGGSSNGPALPAETRAHATGKTAGRHGRTRSAGGGVGASKAPLPALSYDVYVDSDDDEVELLPGAGRKRARTWRSLCRRVLCCL